MSRAAATAGSNTNRRYVLLALTLGLLGAVLVYAAFSRSSGDGSSGAGDTPVVVAAGDIPARTILTSSMVEIKLVNKDEVGDLAYSDVAAVIGQATRFPLVANEQVLASKVVPINAVGTSSATSRSLSFVVPPGHRAFSISVSEVQAAGGLILPGDYVDITVVYDVRFAEDTEDAFLVQTLFQAVEVLAVSQTVVDLVPEATPSASGQRVRNTEAAADPGASTVTLSLTPEEVQQMYLAEANGRVRLALRPYGDNEDQPIDFMTELDLFPRNLPNPFTE